MIYYQPKIIFIIQGVQPLKIGLFIGANLLAPIKILEQELTEEVFHLLMSWLKAVAAVNM